jgi:hypothetical protein
MSIADVLLCLAYGLVFGGYLNRARGTGSSFGKAFWEALMWPSMLGEFLADEWRKRG